MTHIGQPNGAPDNLRGKVVRGGAWLGAHYGLRLTAYVSATGLLGEPGHDYVRPWRDAVMPGSSPWDQPGPGQLVG